MSQIITEFTHPDAPKDFKPGRRCQMSLSECKTAQQLERSGQEPELGKLNRFSKGVGPDTQGRTPLYLCSLCASQYQAEEIEKAMKAEAKRKAREQTWKLPNLTEARKRRGFTQETLARKVGANDTLISHVEHGTRGASYTMAHDIARSLGVSVAHLRGEE